MENSGIEILQQQLGRGIRVLEAVAADVVLLNTLVRAAAATAAVLQNGGKLMVAGNGGSAADAQHIAAEFVSKLCVDRPAMRAVALTVDSSVLTAVGNDYGFEHSFKRQLEAIGRPGDIFLGISTSGNSSNVLRALEEARRQGIATIGLTGQSGGRMTELCDFLIAIPTPVTMYIQQAHLALEHQFCLLVERQLFGAALSDAAIATTERI